MPSQPRHLCEIAHGGLARVGLPVGVGIETDRCIEGQMLRRTGKLLGIEWQHMLQALDEVGHHDADRAEHKERGCILLPILRCRLLESA